MRILQDVRIERAGVFEFSPEEGTEAAGLPNQVDAETKQSRRLIIEELQSGVMDDYNFSRMHETLDVLCEGWDEMQGMYFGRSYATRSRSTAWYTLPPIRRCRRASLSGYA